MARKITEIYDQIITEKQSFSSLNGLEPATETATNLMTELTSGSKVAQWRLFAYIVAVAIWVHEVLFDKHKEDVEKRASELYVGSLLWYHQQCFLFQYGDTLSWNGTKYEYAAITPAIQIIERASVTDVGGQLRIKVAKLVSGLPVKLTTTELNAFTAYMTRVKFAGTNTDIVSRDADLLKIYYDVKVDPLVLSSSGELLSALGTYPVHDAIETYIQNLPFDGILNITKLTDEIQKVEGVIDPIISSASAKYGTLAYSAINNSYNADAGHMIIDSAFPLTNTITYNV